MDNKDFLGTEPIGRLLLRLSIPTVIAQLINMLYNIVDRIYIGHMAENGSLALTGVGVCMPIIVIVSAFASFAASGGAPSASIYMGKKEDGAEKNPRQLLHNANCHFHSAYHHSLKLEQAASACLRCK